MNAELMQQARLLAEAVRRCEMLENELVMVRQRRSVLAAEVMALAERVAVSEAATMVRPFVQGNAPADVVAARAVVINARSNASSTIGWAPIGDALTRDMPAVDCRWEDCRELYSHFHDHLGGAHPRN